MDTPTTTGPDEADLDQNLLLLIGRAQEAIDAQKDRLTRHEARFEAFILDNTRRQNGMSDQLSLLIKKADIAAGRSDQRKEDAARLARRLGVLITLISLMLTALSVFATIHFHFLGL